MHRDRYLEKQQTEKIEIEVRDVDMIQIMKVYACCLGWPSGGAIRELQSDINICYPPTFSSPLINEDLPGLSKTVLSALGGQ